MDWGLRVVAREVAKSMRVSSEAGRRLPSVPRQLYVVVLPRLRSQDSQ